MSLVSDIETIVNDLYPTANFYLMSEWRANYTTINESEAILIVLNNEIQNEDEIKENVNFQTRERIQISVLINTKFDATDVESNDLVEEAKEISRKIYLNLWLLETIDGNLSDGRITHEPIFKSESGIRTGVLSLANWYYNHVIRCNVLNPIQNIFSTVPIEDSNEWKWLDQSGNNNDVIIKNTQIANLTGATDYIDTNHIITSEQKWIMLARLPDQTTLHGIVENAAEVIIGRTAAVWFAAWNNDGGTRMIAGVSDDDWHLFELSVAGFFVDGIEISTNTTPELNVNESTLFIGCRNDRNTPEEFAPAQVAFSKKVGPKYTDTVTSFKAVDDKDGQGNRIANTGLAYDSVNDLLIIAEFNEDRASKILVKNKSLALINTIDISDELDYLQGVAYDSGTETYYAYGTIPNQTPDPGNARIIKFDSDGVVDDSYDPPVGWGEAVSSFCFDSGFLYIGGSPIRKIDPSDWSSTTDPRPNIAGSGEGYYRRDNRQYMGADSKLTVYNYIYGFLYELENPGFSKQESEGLIVDNDGVIWWNIDEHYHGGIEDGNRVYRMEVSVEQDQVIQDLYFQDQNGNTAYAVNGNNGTIVNPVLPDYKSVFLDRATPALSIYGCQVHELNSNPGDPDDYIYVIANADGTFKNLTIPGYTRLEPDIQGGMINNKQTIDGLKVTGSETGAAFATVKALSGDLYEKTETDNNISQLIVKE